jgi:hypothetical protein
MGEQVTTTKPDFNDPGYAQVGCLFVAAGLVIGVVVTVVLIALLAPAEPESGTDPVLQLLAIGLLATEAGFIAMAAVTMLVERVRALWGLGEILIFGSAVVAPAMTVPLATVVPIVSRFALPLSLGILALSFIPMLVVASGDSSARRSAEGRPGG